MLTIRNARETDISSILVLYHQLTITTSPSEAGRNPTAEDYKRVFTQIASVPNLELVVAEDQGEVVGSLMFMIVPNLSHKASPWALVENVIVDERHRGNGIGKVLMEYAIERAKENGCYRIGLSSDNRRTGAHNFYRSLGFESSATGFRMSL
jgi:predicted N-acetyltransferase YhbS